MVSIRCCRWTPEASRPVDPLLPFAAVIQFPANAQGGALDPGGALLGLASLRPGLQTTTGD